MEPIVLDTHKNPTSHRLDDCISISNGYNGPFYSMGITHCCEVDLNNIQTAKPDVHKSHCNRNRILLTLLMTN